MLRDIKITLYDIFGYLFPGIIFLAAIATLFWVIYIPHTPFVLIRLTIEIWVLVLLLAYFSGHIAQALGNLFIKLFPSVESIVLAKGKAGSFPESIIESAKSKASTLLGIDLKDINSETLFSICDEVVVQYGVVEDRDVYQYREGFYRGFAVSFLLFSLSLIVRTMVSGASLKLSNALRPISWYIFLFFIVLSLVCSLLSFLRYRRFARYRVRRAIIGFLSLQRSKDFK